MDTTAAVQNALFEGLTYTDIFIGQNGLKVLVSSMLLALAGNLFKKAKRFNKAIGNIKQFSPAYWLKDNAVAMLTGFFITYVCVRLLNVATPIVLNLPFVKEYIPDPSRLHVGEILIIVSLIIGYYTDWLERYLLKETVTGKGTKNETV